MKNQLRNLLTTLLILPLALIANDEKWYQLEVVAFTTAKSPEVQEQWLSEPEVLSDEQILNLSPGPKAAQPASVLQEPVLPAELAIELDKTAFLLTNHAYSLSRQRGYDVVAHQSWALKGQPKETALWIDLKSDSPGLAGKIRLHLSQYLHFNSEIELKNPDWRATPTLTTETIGTAVLQPAEWVAFNANRRMKIGELHYIDHPLAGMLVKIERYEPEQGSMIKNQLQN